MKRRLPRNQEKELADQARLVREWKAWHAEQLADALAGAHRATIAELMMLLDQLELSSAAVLLDYMQRSDWSSVSYDSTPHGVASGQSIDHALTRAQRHAGDRRSVAASTRQRIPTHQTHSALRRAARSASRFEPNETRK